MSIQVVPVYLLFRNMIGLLLRATTRSRKIAARQNGRGHGELSLAWWQKESYALTDCQSECFIIYTNLRKQRFVHSVQKFKAYYFCNEETMCSFLLTGTHWEVSLSFWKYLDSFLSPRVSYHRPGILNIMSLWKTLIAIKKVKGCGWTYAYVNLGSSRILTIQKHDRTSARGYHQKLTNTSTEEQKRPWRIESGMMEERILQP